MTLIACLECKVQVSDKASACLHCGVPIYIEPKANIYGYTQQFAINPEVQIYWNDSLTGSIKRGQRIELDIERDGILNFRCSFRSSKVAVKAGRVTDIKLSWDRITGRMIPRIVDVVTPGN